MHHPPSPVRPSASQESAPRPLRAPRAVKAQGATRRLVVVLRLYETGWSVRVSIAEGYGRDSYPVFTTFRGTVFEAAAAGFAFMQRHYGPSLERRVWWA